MKKKLILANICILVIVYVSVCFVTNSFDIMANTTPHDRKGLLIIIGIAIVGLNATVMLNTQWESEQK